MLTIIKQAIKTARGAAARSSGYAAEEAAATWLQAQGLRIVERNVRYKFGEIDIVAWEGEAAATATSPAVLVLFEVRLRKNPRFGDAATSITAHKQRRLWAAGQAYAARFKHPPPMRIDVLAYSGAIDAKGERGDKSVKGAQGLDTAPLWIKNALG
jgi:putative endonuclease